ncbi:Flavanone 7-o-glucoside 2''-o-beta-l-rhamnosyltransferase [Heracleum sosnowskyi]|uniref:Flavanone 7-o-glucoside 2''-o-beta-l-rhamnosyltransferase n=1 Tax=Heracleum sosnowskyi TaxID=360622 RepID=A0AAD8J3L0_9APIA|nr:Flavanone 7-o-glucoside 2''-o-beta-l-rhamnosyltransferase [Heracleum sosnowskyi]
MKIVMLPFLAYGHISPFLELAKQLTKRSFNIYICSTPVNLASIKNRVHENDNIQLVELHLSSSPELPPHYHSTKGLPSNLYPILEQTLEKADPVFVNILKDINPDLQEYQRSTTAIPIDSDNSFFVPVAPLRLILHMFVLILMQLGLVLSGSLVGILSGIVEYLHLNVF